MSQAIIAGPKASLEHAYSLMVQFIKVCPEDIWSENFGGWPVWQQAYHALGSLQFMTLQENGTPEAGLYPPEVNMFQSTPDKPPTQEDVLKYGARMKAKSDAYINALQDADLPDINRNLTTQMKAHGINHEFSHSQTLTMLSGHIFYHLGACDAALRERALKGVF